MKKKIMIVHMSRLGDMIQSLPAVKLFKEEHPEYDLTYFGIEDFCVPLRGVPWIDRLITLSRTEIEKISGGNASLDIDRLFREVAGLNEPYDSLVNLTHSEWSGRVCSRIKASERRGRIHSATGDTVVRGRWGKYLFALPENRTDSLLNLTDLYIGMMGVRHRPVDNYLPTSTETDEACLRRLQSMGLRPDKRKIGFQLGASNLLRAWPPERFLELGRRLAGSLGFQIVLFGSPQERALSEVFRNADFPYIDLTGVTSLTELPSFLKSLDLLIGNDTGPMHMAAAVGTKTVGFFMGTAFFRTTGPYGAGHISIQSSYSCAPCLPSTVCKIPLCTGRISVDTALCAVGHAMGIEAPESNADDHASMYISRFDSRGILVHDPLEERIDSFAAHLRAHRDRNAAAQQLLWDEWLGLPANGPVSITGDRGEVDDLIRRYERMCSDFLNLYSEGKQACREITAEFRKSKPRIEYIRKRIAQLERIEASVQELPGPGAMFKGIHELMSAETERCNFPLLAVKFAEKYDRLGKMLDGFRRRLAG